MSDADLNALGDALAARNTQLFVIPLVNGGLTIALNPIVSGRRKRGIRWKAQANTLDTGLAAVLVRLNETP